MPTPASTVTVPANKRTVIRRPASNNAGAATGVLAKTAVFRVDALEAALYLIALAIGSYAYLTDRSLMFAANTAVPVALILALGWGCVRMTFQQVETILTPTFVMRVAILFYGGAGALIPIYASDDTKNYIEAFFRFTDEELLKYNLIVALFTMCFAFSGDLFRVIVANVTKGFQFKQRRFAIEPSSLPLPVVAGAFLVIGALAKYLVILPYQFGFITSGFPLFIAQFAVLENIGLFMGLIWAQRSKPFYVPFLTGYGAFSVLVGVLTFSKIDVILPIVMLSAAFVYVRPTFFRITAAIVAILFAFNVIQPIVNHGRAWISRSYVTIDAPVSALERVNIIADYFNGNALGEADNINYALVRFSYANIGTYVVSARDSGWDGDTLEYLGALFIPRFLWPEKPVLTDIGRDLNIAITGNSYSSVSPGFAAEGYWDGGWPGVVLMAFAVGLTCYLWSLYSLEVQRVGAWHLFVIVLLGVRFGTRFDGFFVVDLVGPLLYGVLGHIVIVLLNRTIAPRR